MNKLKLADWYYSKLNPWVSGLLKYTWWWLVLALSSSSANASDLFVLKWGELVSTTYEAFNGWNDSIVLVDDVNDMSELQLDDIEYWTVFNDFAILFAVVWIISWFVVRKYVDKPGEMFNKLLDNLESANDKDKN